MTTLLHLDSSALGVHSVSRQLTAAIVNQARAKDPNVQVVKRDLGASPLPHLTTETLGQDPEGVLEEFLSADTIVIGVPRYNFGVPSTLKAWIDRIAVAGKTFRYTEQGPVGLAGGKRVVLAIASGGVHAGTTQDFVEPYLRALLGFLGITDITVVSAEGVAMGPVARTRAIDDALARISDVCALVS